MFQPISIPTRGRAMSKTTRLASRLGCSCALTLILVTSATPSARAQAFCCDPNSGIYTYQCQSPGCSGQVTVQGCDVTCQGFVYFLHYVGCCAGLVPNFRTSPTGCFNPNCARPQTAIEVPPAERAVALPKELFQPIRRRGSLGSQQCFQLALLRPLYVRHNSHSALPLF